MTQNSFSVDNLLQTFSDKNFEKGFQFEVLVKWWLRNYPVWKNELIPGSIKLWKESPHKQGEILDSNLRPHFLRK